MKQILPYPPCEYSNGGGDLTNKEIQVIKEISKFNLRTVLS
jgi:hypothetical protein